MARLLVGGDDLRVLLNWLERIGAFVQGYVSIPLASIRSVRVSDDPWSELRGMRYPGTGLRRTIALGTWRHSFGRDFVALYGKGPAVVVDLAGGRFERLVVSARDDAERVAGEIRDAAAETQLVGSLERRDLPEPAAVLERRPQAAALGGGENRARRVDVDPEARPAEPDVREREAGADESVSRGKLSTSESPARSAAAPTSASGSG